MINSIQLYYDESVDMLFLQAFDANKKLLYILKSQLDASLLVEAICIAKVVNIQKNSGIAYLAINEDYGFINFKNNILQLQQGSILKCQLQWLGNDEKQAKFTQDINYVGRYVIINNSSKYIYKCNPRLISQLEKFTHQYKDVGIIFRTMINNLEDLSYVVKELDFLIQKKYKIDTTTSSKMQILDSGIHIAIQFLRNIYINPSCELVTNSKKIQDLLMPYIYLWNLPNIKYIQNLSFNFDEFESVKNNLSIDKESFNLKIHTVSGINIIDINSKNSNLTFFQINYLALDEIIAQIKLKDLTGIIILDLIKNTTHAENLKILTKINELIQDDWRHVRVLGFTNAGLLEMIRNK